MTEPSDLENKLLHEFNRLSGSNLTTKFQRPVESHIVVPKGEYIIEEDIVVTEQGTLEIEPGTTFFFGRDAGILSYGTLLAEGTEDDIISFTSSNGSWRNVTVAGRFSKDSVLDYCKITKAHGRKVVPDTRFFSQRRYPQEFGAGVAVFASNIKVENSLFENNEGNRLGTIFSEQSEITVENCSFRYNSAKRNSTLYMNNNSSGVIKNNEIKDNKADGIHIVKSNFDVLENEILNNEGVGILVWHSDASVDNNQIVQNSGTYGGGGIVFSYSSGTIRENHIEKNQSSIGAGVNSDYSNITVASNKILENHATVQAGGVYINNCKGIIKKNIIESNTSEGDCGGLYVYASNIPIEGNTVQRNKSKSNGGGICLENYKGRIRNNIIMQNAARDEGGGVYIKRLHSPPFSPSSEFLYRISNKISENLPTEIETW